MYWSWNVTVYQADDETAEEGREPLDKAGPAVVVRHIVATLKKLKNLWDYLQNKIT